MAVEWTTVAVGATSALAVILAPIVPALIAKWQRRADAEAAEADRKAAAREARNERRRVVLHDLTFRVGQVQDGLAKAVEAKAGGMTFESNQVRVPFEAALAASEALKVLRDRGLADLGVDGLARIERFREAVAPALHAVDEPATDAERLEGRRIALERLDAEARAFRAFVAGSEDGSQSIEG